MSSVIEESGHNLSGTLPMIQRISYGSLDVAGNLLYCFGSTYILYFYTDVAGISLAIAGFILLLARIVDGIDAPVWGIIIDKTRSKYGKCRPWFLWLPLPFAIFSVLSFFSPDISMTGKAIYAAIFYMLARILFTGLNTPLSAILPLLTLSPKERLVLNSFRMTGGQIGVLLMNATALPLVAFLGDGNDKQGFLYTAGVYALISCGLTLFAFRNIREIDASKAKQEQKLPIKKSFTAMKGNWPWVLMVLANLIFWVALQQRATTIVYYLTYNLDRKDLVPLVNSLATIQILFIVAIPFFSRYMTKTWIWIAGLLVATLGGVLMWVAADNVPLLIVGWVTGNIGSGIACSMPFAMLGFAVDYGNWKTGIKATGLLVAFGSTFCIKMGSGIGTAFAAWIMNAFGYIPNQAQTTESLLGISWAFIWTPCILFALATIPLLFFRQYEAMEDRIHHDLQTATH
ncbi:MFS transporter [Superficieibacter electus]|uniref:MFS transporter n=1 Tax=Superficieibacter electus TaxID=2022662 RepID=A0A2P5GIZ8_9ENTR|nr:MFS transporter [Superficieibacter electus]POP41315.1 MFS transporter [Superficieibacter electus]POP43483.1 MFS transporter [Superficieibacter electus]